MVRAAGGAESGAMTTTPPEAPSDQQDPGDAGPRATPTEMRDLGRLRRSTTDRKVAGVAGGLARHLDIDPVILRVAFVVLIFFGGAGLILYAAAWALVPEDDEPRAAVDLDERSRTVALIALGVIAALALVGDSWGTGFWFPWPLVVVAAVVGLVWAGLGNRRRRDPAAGPPAAAHTPSVGYETAGYGPSAYESAPPRPRDPRKRGPRLFWFTLALVVFCLGVLGVIDQAGADVVDSAYPALAVGVIAVMLLVGSVVGRAGGLILLGLLGSLVLVAGTAADRFDGERLEAHPTTASQVHDSYSMSTGQLVVDLSDVSDPDALDGRSLEVTGQAGQIEVVVPDDVDVRVSTDVQGPGGYELFGTQGGGINWSRTVRHDGGPGAPSMTIDARLDVGQITVTSE